MSATRKLVYASLGVFAGALTTLIGARTTWFVLRGKGASVPVSGLGNVAIAPSEVHRSGFDLVPIVGGLALLLLIAALLLFLLGPRARTVSIVLIGVGSAFVLVRTFTSNEVSQGASTVSSGSGAHITEIGAIVTFAAALVAFPFARAVPRFRMPESEPSEEDAT